MRRFIITIIVLISAIVLNHSVSKPSVSMPRQLFDEFPESIGDWTLVDEQSIGENSMAVLNVDDYLMRSYKDSKGNTLGLYLGYFQHQREGKQIHSPRQCLLGSGWEKIRNEEYLLPLKGSTVPINLYLMKSGKQEQLFLWWYQGRGRIYANEYMNKFYLIWDALTKRRSDGALVRVDMAVNDNLPDILERQVSFINLMADHLPLYIPE